MDMLNGYVKVPEGRTKQVSVICHQRMKEIEQATLAIRSDFEFRLSGFRVCGFRVVGHPDSRALSFYCFGKPQNNYGSMQGFEHVKGYAGSTVDRHVVCILQ